MKMKLRTTPPPNITLSTSAQRRARIKPDLKSKLEEEYSHNPKPNRQEKHRIAMTYGMTDDNVHFWFQNRRARASRESKKLKASQDQDHVGTTSSQPSYQDQALATSFSASFEQRKGSTSASSLIDQRPRLPSIGVLFDSPGPPIPPPPSVSAPTSPPIIKAAYFHHQPFGIESYYLATKNSRSPSPSPQLLP